MAKYKAYPEYKDSDIEWLGKVPSGWLLKKAKYIFQRVQRPLRDIDGVVTAFRDGQVTLRTNRRTDGFTNSVKEIGYQGVRRNDLVIHAMDGFAGAIGVSDSDGKCSPVCSVCIPWQDQPLNMRFYGYLVRQLAVTDFILSLAKGIRERSTEFRFNEFSGLMLPIPPVYEQDQIAKFLDHETAKIDNLIEKQQQLIELLKEKRQAVISHAVTKGLNPDVTMKNSGVEWLGVVPEHWTVCRLKQIIKSGTSISYGIVQPGDSLDEGVPFIQTTNISQGNLQLESLPKTSRKIEQNYHRSRLDGGEVILGIRASIGSAYVVPLELKGANLSRGVARIQPGSSITSDYLVWYLKTNAVEQYWALSKQGSTFSEVSIETVRELAVCVPPKDEQYNIASRLEGVLDRIHKLIVKSEIKMSLLRERRTALISAAVTGKFDVRDWVAPDTQEIEEPQEATV
ncbi:restriction endonuclease subunit S [Raoultella sp. HC6]|uniref:restriction endonuclease subunit S n=1 Tax=Raoultella sp. HC6 TaxID=2923366 RepID=UPI001F5049ED|nr:restriction endonuclease subunit S [Raoultella sp. HC6]